MKAITIRPTPRVLELLEQEKRIRPGVTQTYILNEMLLAGFTRRASASSKRATRRATSEASAV